VIYTAAGHRSSQEIALSRPPLSRQAGVEIGSGERSRLLDSFGAVMEDGKWRPCYVGT
jgi:hypothetical protein